MQLRKNFAIRYLVPETDDYTKVVCLTYFSVSLQCKLRFLKKEKISTIFVNKMHRAKIAQSVEIKVCTRIYVVTVWPERNK